MIKAITQGDVPQPASMGAVSVTRGPSPDVGMAEVLKLLRISMILRLAVSVLTVMGASLTLNGGSPLGLTAALPSLALIVATSIALARGKTDRRTVTWLLVAALVVQAVELAGLRALTGGTFFQRRPPFGRPGGPGGPGDQIESGIEPLLTRGFFSGTLFSAIPAILGAWVYGKRRALIWAGLAVLANMVSDLLVAQSDATPLRFIIGSFVTPGVIVAVLAYFVGTLADQLRQEQHELENANRKLAEQAQVREQLAASRERVRLSRDLHDTLAHTLAGLIVQMNAIATLLDRQPAAAKAELSKAQATAKTGLAETRAAIGDLRANVVQDLGLSGALQRQVELTQQRTRAQVVFEQRGPELALPGETAETLYRIAQEALHNVERHANAKHVSVELCSVSGNDDAVQVPLSSDTASGVDRPPSQPTVTMTIRDDGLGFDVTALDLDRFGIRGMRERAELIGAHLRIDSTPKQGTAVTVKLAPLAV